MSLRREDVEPITKDAQAHPGATECACGCGTVGAIRKKVMRDGLAHVRGCPCKRCTSSRNTLGASARERRLGKAVGGRRNFRSGASGGVDTVDGVCDCEETANVALVRGFRSWWESKTIQAKLAPLMGRSIKPRAFVLYWNRRHRAAVLPYEDFVALCEAACGVCRHCGKSA